MKSGVAPWHRTSFAPWETRSSPTTRSRPRRAATRVFVPTPSMDATTTGSRYQRRANIPPNSRPDPSTPSRWVLRMRSRARRASRASRSTPASRYVRGRRRTGIAPSGAGAFEGEPPGHGLAGLRRGVRPREACQAQALLRERQGLHEALEAQVPQAVRLDGAPDLLYRQAGGDQLASVAGVDPVEAWVADGGRGDPHVDLAGARVAQHPHDQPARRPAHDGVVHEDHPPPGDHLADGVQLNPHPEVAQGG